MPSGLTFKENENLDNRLFFPCVFQMSGTAKIYCKDTKKPLITLNEQIRAFIIPCGEKKEKRH